MIFTSGWTVVNLLCWPVAIDTNVLATSAAVFSGWFVKSAFVDPVESCVWTLFSAVCCCCRLDMVISVGVFDLWREKKKNKITSDGMMKVLSLSPFFIRFSFFEKVPDAYFWSKKKKRKILCQLITEISSSVFFILLYKDENERISSYTRCKY